MKSFAEWCQQNKKEIQENVPCTSTRCIWSVHKSRKEAEKHPFPSLKIVSSKEKADKAEKDGGGENNEPQVVKKRNRQEFSQHFMRLVLDQKAFMIPSVLQLSNSISEKKVKLPQQV